MKFLQISANARVCEYSRNIWYGINFMAILHTLQHVNEILRLPNGESAIKQGALMPTDW